MLRNLSGFPDSTNVVSATTPFTSHMVQCSKNLLLFENLAVCCTNFSMIFSTVGWSVVWTLQPHLWHMMHSCDMARQTKMCLKGVSRNAYSDADWVTPWVCLMLEKYKILQCKCVKSISQLLWPNADACITVGKVQVLVACWLTCCTRNPVAQVWLLDATGWRTLF